MSIELVIPNHLILCCLLLLLPSIFPSIRVFSNKSAVHIRWPKYWSFSFSISCSNEYSGLMSFRMDWLDLLTVQGTLKSLPQHHSSKASILQHSAFFIVQLSHPYMTTGKTIALTRGIFILRVDKRERTQPHPSTENWIKDLLSMALPIRTSPSFPFSQSLPSGSFHKPLIFIHQRADKMKTTITEN